MKLRNYSYFLLFVVYGAFTSCESETNKEKRHLEKALAIAQDRITELEKQLELEQRSIKAVRNNPPKYMFAVIKSNRRQYGGNLQSSGNYTFVTNIIENPTYSVESEIRFKNTVREVFCSSAIGDCKTDITVQVFDTYVAASVQRDKIEYSNEVIIH